MTTTRLARPRAPRGFANLEFVLSLPMVLILLGAIVTGAYVLMNRLLLSESVRRDAWVLRHGEPPAGRLPVASPTEIGALPGVPHNLGKIVVSDERSLTLPAILPDRLHTARMKHAVMGGSWDFQTIPFRARPPLQPDPRLSVYSPGVGPAVLSGIARGLNALGR